MRITSSKDKGFSKNYREPLQNLEPTEKTIRMLAEHYFTLDEMAEIFGCGVGKIRTFDKQYREGRAEAQMKPRMLKRDCQLLLQIYVDGIAEMVEGGTALKGVEAADIRKILEVVSKAEIPTNHLNFALNHLADLSDEELHQRLTDAGYVKVK